MSLDAIFADLVRHHVARVGEPLPPPTPGITWIWAANGIFKRGVDADRDILIGIAPSRPVPGLATLAPYVHFRQAGRGHLPEALLDHILLHARCLRRVEQQYFITWERGAYQVLIPPQEASSARVHYQQPDQPTLIDLHSHHEMEAFFSRTDDRDDTGLSVSGVIGRLDTDRPRLILRANVYGHHQRIPVSAIFAGAGLFHEGRHADPIARP